MELIARVTADGISDLKPSMPLPMGYYDRGKLIYAGSVGTGRSIQLGRSIMAKLQRIAADASSFVAVPRPDAKDARRTELQRRG